VLPALTALLLAGYFGLVVWAWASPSTDPQRGMAEGFLGLVTALLLAFAGVLWIGVHYQRRWLVWVVFWMCAWPVLTPIARGIYLLVRWVRGG
jgi:hypothetical protein